MQKMIGDRAGPNANGGWAEHGLNALIIAWVILRVSLIISLWLVLCLGVFLGYLTIPLVILLAFTLAYVGFGLARSLRGQITQQKERTGKE